MYQNSYRGPRWHIPVEDLILYKELQVCEDNNWDSYLCPCRKCHGGHRYSITTVQIHLREFRRDPFLMHSMVGGDPADGYPARGIWVQDGGDVVLAMNVFDDAEMGTEYGDHLDPYHDIQQQLFDTFDLGDRLREDTPHVFEDEAEEVDNVDGTEDFENLDNLYQEGTKLVYGGTSVSVISATIVLINMAIIHNISNAYVDELLKYLSSMLLPKENRLPKSHYEAKRLIRKLGLIYHVIHTCPEGCVFYRGEYAHLANCPKPGCGKSRYIGGSECILVKDYTTFPLNSKAFTHVSIT
jgi:hypothetical protein